MMDWISVDDRLPDGNGYYLACFDKAELDELGYENRAYETYYAHHPEHGFEDGWWEFSGPADDGVRVTHWMPIPEPPSEWISTASALLTR